jgi:hypothetical protein
MSKKMANIESILLNSEEVKKLEGGVPGINIYDLIRFAHIDEINHVLNVTRSLLNSGELQETVEEYRAWRDQVIFRLMVTALARRYGDKDVKVAVSTETAADGKQVQKLAPDGKIDGKPIFPPFYTFELAPYGPGDWGVTTLTPFPPAFEPHYTILPREVIDKMSRMPVDPRTINMVTVDLAEDETAEIIFGRIDLCFIRVSEIQIIGVVSQHLGDWWEKFTQPDMDWVNELEKNPEAAEPLFSYLLHNDPTFSDDFIAAFVNEILPELRD